MLANNIIWQQHHEPPALDHSLPLAVTALTLPREPVTGHGVVVQHTCAVKIDSRITSFELTAMFTRMSTSAGVICCCGCQDHDRRQFIAHEPCSPSERSCKPIRTSGLWPAQVNMPRVQIFSDGNTANREGITTKPHQLINGHPRSSKTGLKYPS